MYESSGSPSCPWLDFSLRWQQCHLDGSKRHVSDLTASACHCCVIIFPDISPVTEPEHFSPPRRHVCVLRGGNEQGGCRTGLRVPCSVPPPPDEKMGSRPQLQRPVSRPDAADYLWHRGPRGPRQDDAAPVPDSIFSWSWDCLGATQDRRRSVGQSRRPAPHRGLFAEPRPFAWFLTS